MAEKPAAKPAPSEPTKPAPAAEADDPGLTKQMLEAQKARAAEIEAQQQQANASQGTGDLAT